MRTGKETGNGDNSHDTCDKNTDNSELLPLRQMQPLHGRTEQNQNNQIQQNRQTSKKYDERQDIVILMALILPFLFGGVIGPMTIEREKFRIVYGDHGDMGEDEDREGGVDGVLEAFGFGKDAQIEHQDCYFDETDCDEVR